MTLNHQVGGSNPPGSTKSPEIARNRGFTFCLFDKSFQSDIFSVTISKFHCQFTVNKNELVEDSEPRCCNNFNSVVARFRKVNNTLQ